MNKRERISRGRENMIAVLLVVALGGSVGILLDLGYEVTNPMVFWVVGYLTGAFTIGLAVCLSVP
jgi:fatty acid desaturase